ncbi:MAG: hypothetical protein OHK93_008814 [Ramalina farinacea]|uniref:Uncharacterized protein n=1 Tax=Ramalina farinacea TaxID=258253 RepID=A0AA43QRF9_9LECA|nr:hypothetical protein [Ramalina farinacea]
MKTFTASSLLVLATQLLSISANPVPVAEANNLVARTCDCTAHNNAIAAGDQNAAANAISTCSTPCPAGGATTSPGNNNSGQAKSYDVGSYTQQWGDYTPTLWYDSPNCYPCPGRGTYKAGCHCEDCEYLPQPCKAAP